MPNDNIILYKKCEMYNKKMLYVYKYICFKQNYTNIEQYKSV